MCYLTAIMTGFFSANIMRYSMYSIIIGSAAFMGVFTRKSEKISNNCQYLVMITLMIVSVPLINGLIKGECRFNHSIVFSLL